MASGQSNLQILGPESQFLGVRHLLSIRISTFVLRNFADISALPVAIFPGSLIVNCCLNRTPQIYVPSNA
ncbi:MAG: hypothetical protein DME98_15895 [Verrucomicrobia bacterium]|nr:MAG: hypothetical protein DME98_15895 [Verrucomicrobiota bacterium]PYJ32251.1 MAG: hypothetical protein DME88_11735 [Verrucomicrobiota bacterium]PYJ38994.1 MAG: hypothetical protein DME84_03300 [Verrucomicrobiota bacterium]